jgi:gliding motility-associated-like protein
VGTVRTLTAIPSGGSGNYSYVWVSNLDIDNPSLNGNGVVIDTTDNSTYNVSPAYEKNLYWLVLIDNNNIGCSTPVEADTIYAVNGQDLNVPNLITPNDDNKNDHWVLKDKKTGQDLLPGSKFDLYNRWGQRIFTMDSYDNRFKADNISDGVYYYYVKSGCGDKEYKGWLQILGNTNP